MMKARAWTSWLACAATAFLMAACGGGGGGSGASNAPAGSDSGGNAGGTTPVSYSVRLSTTSAQVGVGHNLTISAVVIDSNGTDVTANSSFAWTSGDNAVATVAGSAATSSSAVIRGIAAGTTSVQVVPTVKASDSLTVTLPAQSAAISVLPAGALAYTLSVPANSLSMVDGQVLPFKVSLIDSNGTDVSASVHDWAWASSASAVQVSANQNSASLRASNSTSSVLQADVTVSVTAPNGGVLNGVIAVTVQKTGFTYRVVTSQGGQPIDALQVLNGYPKTFSARVLRNDDQDATADFDGVWTYTVVSPTLSVTEAAGTHDATVSTSLPNGSGPLQSVLKVTAVSTKLAARPAANLLVTEQPTWALVSDVQQPLTLLMVPGMPIPVTALVKHLGNPGNFTDCANWAWSSTGSVTTAPTFLPNQVNVSPVAPGDFTVTATCTSVVDQMPLTVTVVGNVK